MIGLVGLDHQLASAEVRGRLALSAERLGEALAALALLPSVDGAVVLSTCNRTEIYVTTPDVDASRTQVVRFLATLYAAQPVPVAAPPDSAVPEASLPAEVERELYAYEGAEAARHLIQVAAGLRSMVVGEAQILGQVKDALLAAERAGTLDEELRAAFTVAIKTGKRVRAETELGRADVSIARLAMRVAAAALGGLSGRAVLLIGAGRTSQLCAEIARNEGASHLLFANRTASVAAEVAREIGGEPIALYEIPARLPEIDLVVSATAAPHLMLTAQTVAAATTERSRPLVILDLAVPPDVEPSAGLLPGVTLHTIDTLRAEQAEEPSVASTLALATAERIVDESVREFVRGQTLRLAVPGIAALRRHVDRSALAELEATLTRLEHLSPEDRAIVARLGQRLVDKMFHYLVVRVRSLAEYDEVSPQITMQVLARLLADPDAPHGLGEDEADE
jgi:glutamyl-tRNA reductase